MNSGPTLTIGSTGPDVRRLQIILVMIKLLDVSAIDSVYGPKTQDAVKSFQQGNNLTADGIVGPLTWKALPADPKRRHSRAVQPAVPIRIAKGVAGVWWGQYCN
jgi:peptidoglycan hydrolase-like protein with peptidoglycan-binding domain